MRQWPRPTFSKILGHEIIFVEAEQQQHRKDAPEGEEQELGHNLSPGRLRELRHKLGSGGVALLKPVEVGVFHLYVIPQFHTRVPTKSVRTLTNALVSVHPVATDGIASVAGGWVSGGGAVGHLAMRTPKSAGLGRNRLETTTAPDHTPDHTYGVQW